MLRYVDHGTAETGYRFSWFDTRTDRFVIHDGAQAWDSWEDFEECCEGDTSRYRAIFPRDFATYSTSRLFGYPKGDRPRTKTSQ